MTKVLADFLANGGEIQKCPPGAAWGVRGLFTRGQRVGSVRGHSSRGRAMRGLNANSAFPKKTSGRYK